MSDNNIQNIVDETPVELIEKDLEVVRNEPHSLILTEKQYEVYITTYKSIPNIIREIGRLREITFRAVGEGTNKSIDLDDFDVYYSHLFIWDKEERRIGGAYRVGHGKQIFKQYGKKGFYINTLFNIDDKFGYIFESALELGRSFVRKEYQQKPLTLFLLWKGISSYVMRSPDHNYLIGPVSISNLYTNLSQSIIVNYIKKNHRHDVLSEMIKPTNPFMSNYSNAEIDEIISDVSNIKELDNLVAKHDDEGKKVPVLMRQYIQLDGTFLEFNVDPDFGNALDGFLFVSFKDIPTKRRQKLLSGSGHE